MTAPDGRRTARSGLPIAEAIGTRRLVVAIVAMPIVAIAAVVAIILYAQGRPVRATRPVEAAQAPATQTPVVLPAGARIAETTSDGRHLILRIEAPSGAGEIAIYDIASGRRLRTIAIVAQ